MGKKPNPMYLNNNLSHVGNHNLKIINNQFHLWYLTSNTTSEEIYRYVSNDGYNCYCPNESCLIIKKQPPKFPDTILNDSDTLIFNDNIYLYYSGIHNGQWQIGLATEKPYTPTPTPIPTPTPKPKIIIIPGLFASWNKEAILHNKKVPYDQWKLPSYVHEYDGLINTLENIGYQNNEDFYIFPYDWRQPIKNTVEDLNQFITNLNDPSNFNLIGHSLGGLIARIFTQKYQDRVNQIISVGSPHQGAFQVYKPLSSGEIDRENTFMWLAQKLILVLNKDSLQSDRETIQKKFPVAFDLLPLFDFLKKESGELISTNSMILKNPTLPKYNFSFPQIYHQFTAIFAKNIDTPEYYLIEPPSLLDNLLGNYQDGHPVSLSKNNGDGTILTKSPYEKDDSDNLLLNNFITARSFIKKRR